MKGREKRNARGRLYPDLKSFFIGFALPLLAVLAPVAVISYMASSRIVSAIQGSTAGAARESLIERKRILSEAILSAKRAAYEVAHNSDAIKLIAWTQADDRAGTGNPDPLRLSVETYMRRLVREISYYESIFYLDRAGREVFGEGAVDLFASVPPAASEYFLATARGNVALSGPYSIGSPERHVVVASSPSYGEDNRYIGAAGIVISVDRFLNPVTAPRLQARFRYGLLDESGFIISSDGVDEHRYFPAESASASTVTASILNRDASSGFMRLASGEQVLTVWEPVDVKPWSLYALIPAADVRQPVILVNFVAWIGLLTIGLSFSLAIMRSRRVHLQNGELAAAIEELARAQELIIKTERSAVLGSAVAGLAHELNTPIGVALTSASFVRDLSAPVAEGEASDPAATLIAIRKASNILESSLKRASAVVNSFKRVSADGGDETLTVLELGQALEDAVNILSGPLTEADAHPVFTRDVPVYVRTSYAAINRTVASIVAGAAALPSQFGPKLFQVMVSGVDEKALIEFSLRPLPALDASAAVSARENTVAQRFPGRTIEAGIVSTLVEKDLGGEALVKSSKDGGFTVTIRMEKARIA